MIATVIILSLSLAVIAGLALYWKNIVAWIKKAIDKIKEVLGIAVQGTRTFLVKHVGGAFKNISKYYSVNKMTGEWEETVYTKSVSESEIPADILQKALMADFDVEVSTTEELQLALNA